MNKSKLKILLVSDTTNFALTDVFHGYQKALEKLNIPYEVFPYHRFRELFSETISCHVLHSTALIKSKKITHIMFIGGLNIPPWMFESMYDLKTVLVATEDPHAFDPLKKQLNKIDYYFTNERSIAKKSKNKNVYYCPTGACPEECGKLPRKYIDKKYHSDLLFLGALYPNRVKILEGIIPTIKRYNINLKICGHVGYMKKSSPLWEYVFDARTIPHNETIKYYNGTKAAINIFRNVRWNAKDNTHKNPYNTGKYPPESMNPRSYEVPLCQTFLLQDNTRSEVNDIFSEKEIGLFNNIKSLNTAIKYYLKGPGIRKRRNMILRAYKKVALNHTYAQRMLKIQEILESDL